MLRLVLFAVAATQAAALPVAKDEALLQAPCGTAFISRDKPPLHRYADPCDGTTHVKGSLKPMERGTTGTVGSTRPPPPAPHPPPPPPPSPPADLCSCTGSGNQIHCTVTGNRYCSSTDACYAPTSEQHAFGKWSGLCRTRDRCSCTGQGNQIRCSESGIRYCASTQACYAPTSQDFGFGEWGSLCR